MIRGIFWEHRRRYGARRIVAELDARRESCGRRRAARLMGEMELVAIQPRSFRPRTTDSRHTLGYSPNLLVDRPPPDRVNQIWVGDITYVPLAGGDLLFLAMLAMARPKGIPIGNLTSQFLANVYLNELDHFVKEELCCAAYARYADDFVLFGDDKERLWEWRERVAARLVRLRLALHADKTVVSSTRCGLKFLGFKLHRCGRRLLGDGLSRFRRRLRHYRRQLSQRTMSIARLGQSIRAWIAHTRHCNGAGVRRALLGRLRFR
jgi:hypothetical protein